MTGHDHHAHREDADYRLVQASEDGVFTFEDKRTGHKFQFNDAVPNGYGNAIFLYYYPIQHRDEGTRTVGYKNGILDRSSLPEWLIEEFRHIHDEGCLTPATDPRGDER